MRLIDADELMEHVWRDKLDSRELIAKMINYAPTVKDIPIKIPINIFEQLISQESCKDCISRQDALNAITMSTERWQAVEYIKELPPVLSQVERAWIPVSEDTPKEGETVIASTKYGVYPEARYTKEYGWEWAYESGADYWRELEDVEAWMPLPERYKAEREGKNDESRN